MEEMPTRSTETVIDLVHLYMFLDWQLDVQINSVGPALQLSGCEALIKSYLYITLAA